MVVGIWHVKFNYDELDWKESTKLVPAPWGELKSSPKPPKTLCSACDCCTFFKRILHFYVSRQQTAPCMKTIIKTVRKIKKRCHLVYWLQRASSATILRQNQLLKVHWFNHYLTKFYRFEIHERFHWTTVKHMCFKYRVKSWFWFRSKLGSLVKLKANPCSRKTLNHSEVIIKID